MRIEVVGLDTINQQARNVRRVPCVRGTDAVRGGKSDGLASYCARWTVVAVATASPAA